MKKEYFYYVLLPELRFNKDYLMHANWSHPDIWPKQ